MGLGKRAQIGKFLVGFVSFLLIVLFVGVFIALSSVLAKTHGAGKQTSSEFMFFGQENNLLFQSIEIKIDKKSQKVLVADALIYQKLGKINNFELTNSLRKLMNEENNCLGLIFGKSIESVNYEKEESSYFNRYGQFHYRYEKGESKVEGKLSKVFKVYNEQGVLQKSHFSFIADGKKEELYAETYFGHCLEEAGSVK